MNGQNRGKPDNENRGRPKINGREVSGLVRNTPGRRLVVAPGHFKKGDVVEGLEDRPLKIKEVVNPDLPAMNRLEEMIEELKGQINRSPGQRNQRDPERLKEIEEKELLLKMMGKVKHLVLSD